MAFSIEMTRSTATAAGLRSILGGFKRSSQRVLFGLIQERVQIINDQEVVVIGQHFHRVVANRIGIPKTMSQDSLMTPRVV